MLMKVDITQVLEKIKVTTELVNEIDAQDVTTADMKSMNHFKKYSDGIIDHIKANPNLDPNLLKSINETLLNYRNALNAKHGEAQGKSEFIADKCNDMNDKYNDLLDLEKAIKKAQEIKESEEKDESAKNTLADPLNKQEPQNSAPPERWQEKEMNLLNGSMKLISICLKTAVGLPLHATAAIIGGGAGLIGNTASSAINGFNNTRELRNQRLVEIDPADIYINRNKELKSIEAGKKLLNVMSNIGAVSGALSVKGYGVVKNNASSALSFTKDASVKVYDFTKDNGIKLLDGMNKVLDKAKEDYLTACLDLSTKSKEKLKALNEDLKNLTVSLVDSFKNKLEAFSDNVKGWASNIANSLSNLVSSLKTMLQPHVAHNASKTDLVVGM
jgi:hypothetical protein